VSNREDIPLHTSSSSLILSRTESSTPRLNVVDLKVLRHTAATMDAGCERASVGESARKLRMRRQRRALLDKANIFLSQCTSASIFFFVRRATCTYRRPSHSRPEVMQAASLPNRASGVLFVPSSFPSQLRHSSFLPFNHFSCSSHFPSPHAQEGLNKAFRSFHFLESRSRHIPYSEIRSQCV
jgi:hypothetical protein